MATTPKGIYYPNDYNEIADIPEDMKKMAESIEEVFEDTDSDLSDIKEEQTTQNNRLNSLEVDNTTNKSDILTNKQDINNIKAEQTTQNTNIQNNANAITNLSNRVTETEEDISDIQEEQAEQNTNITTNATNIESLQEENENLKKIVAQMPQVTGQGTEVTLENTIEAQFTKFDVEGNSTQETTEGYNMLDLDKYSYSESSSALNGGTVTIKDGVITLNATNATGNMTALSVTKLANADSIEAGTYYFGVDVYGAYESTPNTNIWEYRGNRTLTEKFIIKQWRYAVTKGNIGSTPILISNDTSKTTYEPYTGGIALPNPDNEVPILSAGDNGSINEKISNKNVAYFNILNKVPSISNGEMVDYNGAGSTYFIKIDNNQNYIFSYSSSKTSSKYIMFYDKTKNYLGHVVVTTNNYILGSYEKYNQTRYVKLRVDNLSDYNWLQLEPGTTATSYVPHEEQDYSIFVQQPMRSIGDVRDCFVKVDGVWNEVHYIREKDLGECTWQPVNNDENSRTQGLFTSFSVQNIENYSTSTTTIPKLLSNKYISKPNYKYQYYGRNPQDHTISTFNGNILYIQNSDFSGYTNQQVKEALAGTVLQYVLKNPTYLPCTEEQVEQLENLPSTYKDFTIIQSEDETPAYLEVSGIRDINTMFDKVTNAIVSLGGNV